MTEATQIRKGNIISYKDSLWVITNTHHVTKGNKRGFVRLTIKNLLTGQTLDEKFSSNDNLEQAYTEYKDLEYSYQDSDSHVFMNTSSYEQISLTKAQVDGNDACWLFEGQTYRLVFYEGKPIALELPNSLEIEVEETEPFIKGQTASRSYKPSKLKNGVSINVPPFISQGDLIKVNPNTVEYLERASKQE